MNNWTAHRTSNPQGIDFREITLNGKVSELQFTVKPCSDYWRAGFKLVDPNGAILPLRSPDSLLFHLGSTPSNEEYGFTAYRNGEWIKELNKTQKYPEGKLLMIRLEINHNNFLKVYVNGSLEFRPAWHLEKPNIREKVALMAWGDEDDYKVDFKDITAANWKNIQSNKQKHSKMVSRSAQINKSPYVFSGGSISAGRDIIVANRSYIKHQTKSSSSESLYEKWWIKYLVLPIIAGVVIAFLVFKFGLNGERKENIKQSPTLVQTPFPTASVNFITPVEIIVAINNLPPLQQRAAAENYKGIKVFWSVHLVDGSTSVTDRNLYTIFLRGNSPNPIITCDVDLINYPQLKVTKRDQVFTVEGEISNVDLLSINLINCKLSF